VRPALAGSVVWGLAVWWLGEGLGGLLTGAASPASGAPGAALLYALAAVLLWPPRSDAAVSQRAGSRLDGMASRLGVIGRGTSAAGRPGQRVPYVAGQAAGVRAAAAVWLVLWGGLAALAVQPAVRAPRAFGGLLAGLAGDAPGGLARADRAPSAALGGHGLVASVLLAVLMAAIGLAGCRPDRAPVAARAAVAAAAVSGLVTAAAGGFGELFTGMATDPGTGPVLALVALAYWPRRLTLTAFAGQADLSTTSGTPDSRASSVTPASLSEGTAQGAAGPRPGGEGTGSWG
jgi:hypothetical protein